MRSIKNRARAITLNVRRLFTTCFKGVSNYVSSRQAKRDYTKPEHGLITSVRVAIFGAKNSLKLLLSDSRRMSAFLLGLLLISFATQSLLMMPKEKLGRIDSTIEAIVGESVPLIESKISYSEELKSFIYNKGYKAGGETLGFGGGNGFTGGFPVDPTQGVSITDPITQLSMKIIPKFKLGSAEQDGSRIVYKMTDYDGLKILSLNGIGYKEDLVLNSFRGDRASFEYEIELSDAVEMRMEDNGSIGFYSVESVLLGDIAVSSEEDQALLDEARSNGDKSNLIFSIPAPIAIGPDGHTDEGVNLHFEIKDNTIALKASGLKQAQYPLSLDPSVYIETARKFMLGNNETNVDFDTANELIQKGTTTGARFDDWSSSLSLNNSLYDGATAVAGGYAYYVGGVGSAGTPTSTEFTSNGSYNVPSGVDKVIIEAWGAGGGGGGGGTVGDGGTGGGGAYVNALVNVTALESLTVEIGGGGGAGDFSSGGSGTISGDGGGGGGHTEVNRTGTPLVIAAGGGGGGGGDNSSATPGGDGGPGGDNSDGFDGTSSSSAGGGGGATSSSGGSGGTGGNNTGSSGGSQSGGDGADGRSNQGSDGSKNNGGTASGGDGGNGDQNSNGYGAGGGGGSGYYGGGGGSGSLAGDAGGGGGGSGTSYVEPSALGSSYQSGSGSTPGNSGDIDRGSAGDGGSGGPTSSSGSDGSDGKVIITPYLGVEQKAEVYWSSIDPSTGTLTSPNPGDGACTDWCTDTAYDLPEARRGFSMVAYNGFLYVIGGLDETDTRVDSVLIAKIGANGEPSLWHPTDPDPDNWVYWFEDTGGALATATSYGAALGYNNRLYFLGGSTASSPGGVTTVQYTNLEPTGTLTGWTTTGMVAMSTSRFQHTVEVYNDYLYVIGGDSSASGSLLNSVEYIRLDDDGTFLGSWESTASFNTARRTDGGDFTTIFGAYIYLSGGCSSVSSGDCQTVYDDVQLASINSDGSITEWITVDGAVNSRSSYGLHAWQDYIYSIGGCSAVDGAGECSSPLANTDYAAIKEPGEVSTVSITVDTSTAPCTGGSPYDCDMPPTGDGAGQGGQMLNATVALNGYLYLIGGCTNFGCSGSSGNVSYVAIGGDGSLQAPATCGGTSYGAWCVDSTNRVNGTTGVSAAGVTTFNNRIYIVGGIDETNDGTTAIYYNSTNADGSLAGSWSSTSFAAAGISGELSYTYAYARANPNNAASAPGNLYVIGGCSSFSASAGCSSSYNTEVYKCNIGTTGAISGCTTSGQLQLDVELSTESNQGLGLHSGTVYANYIYLIGGYSDNVGDRDTVFYAKFDDSNNIVDAESGTADLGDPDDDWIESDETLSVGRRRGWAFGYNGHIYAVGGYDDTGTGIIPFIEWAKLSVSDGSLNGFVTSDVTINQRWGLSMVVTNSYAYVIGGCDVGPSPSGCSSFEPSIQTFQIYNNDSGTVSNYTESAGSFATNNDRIGSSAVILNGYIYVAGGETSSTATANVQFAKLNPNGTIGTWADTTASLPAARAYGQLETAGGSLYYIGGEDSAGDEKQEVYYSTPSTTAGTSDTIRTTTYKLDSTEFSGTTYTLTLNQDLEQEYFVMINGSDDSGGVSGPDVFLARVSSDPYGNFTSSTGSNDQIELERGSASDNWVGTVTVVECVSSCATDGFVLDEVLDTSLADSNELTDETLASAHSTNTVPFGGLQGGGVSTTETGTGNISATAGVRIHKNSTNQIRIERMDNGTVGTAGNASAADVTTYVVTWGSNWNVEEVDFDDWQAGGGTAETTGSYTTQSITAVDPDNTWIWKSSGTSEDNGLGDGAFGKIVSLGDGININYTSETSVALGSVPNGTEDIKDDTVYVMEHSSLAVDHRFLAYGNQGTSFSQTVDSAIVSETVATVGNVTSSEGYRIPTFWTSDNGTGTNYPRPAGWGFYHNNSTSISFSKGYTGNNQVGWIQSVDFGNMAGSGGGAGDVATWSTASNGLPADRTRHGASVWNDRLYVVGGLDDSASPTSTVYISPILSSGGNITSAWTSDADVPDVARSGGALVGYANNLYYLGGNDGSNYFSDVQFSSIGYKEGTISQSGNTVTGSGTTFTSSMVGSTIQYIDDGSTAVITAFNSATSIDVDVSKSVTAGAPFIIDDGSVGEWTFTTSLPRYTSDAEAFAANGFLYVVGGRSAASTCTNNTYVVPISANTTIATRNNPTGIGEWFKTNNEFTGDRYSAGVAYSQGKVYLTGGGCGTELTSNQHYYGTLDAQPQVARWSYFVDADSDVFPNAWLLNGLDNNIGARWQFAYRSSTDTANTWGVDTDFGDVTLGTVEDYIPYDGAGSNTNFARYFYVTVSIDASQTYGYPDDVTRGPTVDDLTIFFVSDPSKRLRHGKTFIRGLQQPLDTPPPGY